MDDEGKVEAFACNGVLLRSLVGQMFAGDAPWTVQRWWELTDRDMWPAVDFTHDLAPEGSELRAQCRRWLDAFDGGCAVGSRGQGDAQWQAPVRMAEACAPLDETNRCLDGFLQLKPGWDSYGARPIRSQAVLAAKEMAKLVVTASWEYGVAVSVEPVPVCNGGVELNFASPAGLLEAECEGCTWWSWGFDSAPCADVDGAAPANDPWRITGERLPHEAAAVLFVGLLTREIRNG